MIYLLTLIVGLAASYIGAAGFLRSDYWARIGYLVLTAMGAGMVVASVGGLVSGV